MKTITLQAEVTSDQKLRLDLACEVPPGPVDVTVTVLPRTDQGNGRRDWGELRGLGREVWRGIDAFDYVRQLREDRDDRP